MLSIPVLIFCQCELSEAGGSEGGVLLLVQEAMVRTNKVDAHKMTLIDIRLVLYIRVNY